MIYTFYSYKGGVGRSMALANIAELFFQGGHNVVMIDWDLEAPGLEQFFHERLNIDQALDHPGLIDMLLSYKRQMAYEQNFTDGDLPFEKPEKYMVDIYAGHPSKGRLRLLPAGRRFGELFATYADAVRSFDWADFYQNWEGELYFDWLRQQLEAIADVILIDSRTGVTEMGGVCTYQMADTIIMLCASNQQSIDGTYEMAQNFVDPEVQRLRGDRPLNLLILPARLDNAESDDVDKFQIDFAQKFHRFMPQETDMKQFFTDFGIPYVPKYSFRELVAVREGAVFSAANMTIVFRRLHQRLDREFVSNSLKHVDQIDIRFSFTDDFAMAASVVLDNLEDKELATKLSQWTNIENPTMTAAFNDAVYQAIDRFNHENVDIASAERVLRLLIQDTPELQNFRQIVIQELLLSAEPNIGRLIDNYRRNVRFAALLRNELLPSWTEIETTLRSFLGTMLREELMVRQELRSLLLEQSELRVLDNIRTTVRIGDNTNTLRRIEALLEEMITLPRISRYTTASNEGAILQRTILDHYIFSIADISNLEALYQRYQGFLVESFGSLDFRGIMQVQNVVRLRLEEVYIPLRGQRINPESIVKSTFIRFPIAQTSYNSIMTLHDLIRDTPLLVLLGDPGSGKSTLVRYIMLALVEGRAAQQLGLGDEWLPILFPIAAFAEARERQPDLAPLDHLSEYYKGLSQPDYGPLFQRALLAGRALVLFDGLDEVREGRLALVRSLEAFVHEWDLPGNRFLATSRIAGYDDAPLDERVFVRATVEPFDDNDIRMFTQKWSYAYERAGTKELPMDPQVADAELRRRAETRAGSLSTAVFANPNVTELARNPLLLTILALIHNQGTRLPDRRVDLYRLCVEALSETWNRARSLSGREIDVYLGEEKLDERFVVNLLGPAALWIHAEQPGGLVEQGGLERQLARTLVQTDGLPLGKAQRLARSFIELVRRHTGLLQERGHRRYGFLHLTFEEYLAARALIESATVDDADALILQRCADAGWREVLRLALASASQKEAQRLLLLLLAAPTTAETHGRPVVLAGECLLDIGRNAATQRAWSAVIEHLVVLSADMRATITARVEGGHVLGRLGDPRLLDPRKGDAPIGGYWCPIEAGPFWYGDDRKDEPLQQITLPTPFKIARYPVTNAEYQRFIDDDGYNGTRPWWTEHGRAFLKLGGHRYDDQEQPITLPRLWNDPQYNSPSQPVVGVSWYEAAAYCAWLTMQGHQAGWLPQADQLRLPTSLEWERAARHTDKRRYPWGDAEPDAERANYDATGIGEPSPVGCFPQGAAVCGALDLAGNVLEWMATSMNTPLAAEPQKDFTPDEGVLLSGSAFWRVKEYLYCGARSRGDAFGRDNNQGFRVIWSPHSSDQGV